MTEADGGHDESRNRSAPHSIDVLTLANNRGLVGAVICVVDGSPDGTLSLVQKHAKQDLRIRWLYQENAGAGAARNAGLDLARGEYLAFLDADDLYDSRFLIKMYETATRHDADLVMCQIEHIDCKTGEVTLGFGFRNDRVPVDRLFRQIASLVP